MIKPAKDQANTSGGGYGIAQNAADMAKMETAAQRLIEKYNPILAMGKEHIKILEMESAGLIDETTAYKALLVGAAAPSGDSYDFELLARESASYDFEGHGSHPFTPTATLAANLSKGTSQATIELANVSRLSSMADELDTFAIINDEMVKVVAIDVAASEITIERAVLDTVPAAHSLGDRIWFFEAFKGTVGDEYEDGDTPSVKMLSRTANGGLAEGDATARTASALNSRMIRPYPPGNFKVDGSSYPASFSDQPDLTWNHRSRVDQTTELILQTEAADYGPESGQTYTLKIYDEDDNLVRTETGLTGKSYTYSEANERADCGIGPDPAPLNTQLRFVLYSVRGGFDSWQSHDITVSRA